MVNTSCDALREAITRNGAAVISFLVDGQLKHHKTRFLADAGDGFWVESVSGAESCIDGLIRSQSPVGMAFKSSAYKVVFAVPILVRQRGYPISAEEMVEALLLRFPDEVKQVLRRSSYRFKIRSDWELKVRIWRITERAHIKDRPTGATELPAEIKDLSAGGAGLVCAAQEGGEEQCLVANQRLRVQLRHEETEVLLEARCRSVAINPDHSMRVGIQFKGLEESLEGRQALSKLNAILGTLSRNEARRIKLGLSN